MKLFTHIAIALITVKCILGNLPIFPTSIRNNGKCMFDPARDSPWYQNCLSQSEGLYQRQLFRFIGGPSSYQIKSNVNGHEYYFQSNGSGPGLRSSQEMVENRTYWLVIPHQSGSGYMIKSDFSGKCLDLNGDSDRVSEQNCNPSFGTQKFSLYEFEQEERKIAEEKAKLEAAKQAQISNQSKKSETITPSKPNPAIHPKGKNCIPQGLNAIMKKGKRLK